MSVDKLVDSTQLDSDLTSVANAIRSKGGTSVTLTFPADFVTAIGNIPTGITPTGTKNISISSAGTTTEDVTNYASAAITVGAGTEGTPTATKGAVNNHAIAVTPSVTNSAGYISGGTKNGTAVSVSASELVSGTYSVTSSGTKDVTNYASVSVPSGSASTHATTLNVTPTISVSNIGLISASVTDAWSLTPDVSAGYISSGTSGTVRVTASNTQQLPVYAGAHHASAVPHSVCISLTNPVNGSEFSSCSINEQLTSSPMDLGNVIGSINSPTGSTTISVSPTLYGISIFLEGMSVGYSSSNISCTGGVTDAGSNGMGGWMFEVTGDGTITFDGVDYDD